jgi:hypothetical protein
MISSGESTLPLKTSRWRKVAGFLLVGFGSLFAVLVGGLLLLMWSCEPPSIDTLASRFPRQRKDVETILSMSDHDAQFTRIDPDWLATTKHQYLSYSPETGITLER